METQPQIKDRPTFLTIVCILSFIGLGLSIFNKFISLITIKSIEYFQPLIKEGFDEAISSGGLTYNMEVFFTRIQTDLFDYFDHLPAILGMGLAFAILALIGVVLMWQMKRLGFYMYVAGRLLVVFSHIMICGGNFFAAIVSASDGFFVAVFIVLYAMNFKHLN